MDESYNNIPARQRTHFIQIDVELSRDDPGRGKGGGGVGRRREGGVLQERWCLSDILKGNLKVGRGLNAFSLLRGTSCDKQLPSLSAAIYSWLQI